MKHNLTAIFLFLILLYTSRVFAANDRLHDPSGKLNLKTIDKEKETYLFQESVLKDRNRITGILDDAYYTGQDKTTLSFRAGLSPNPFKILSLITFDLNLSRNLGTIWIEFFLAKTIGTFGQMSENRTSLSTNPTSESNFQREDDSKQDLTNLGLGIGHRFKFPDSLNLFSIKDLFHTPSFFFTYNALSESFRGQTYNGFGIRADYGLHKRTSRRTHLGVKFSYQLANVTRGEVGTNESRNDRRLILSWVSMAFDYTYYF